MYRHKKFRHQSLVLVALALACLAGSAVAADAPPGDPLEMARSAFQAAESPEARLAIVKTFLTNHRDHPGLGAVSAAGPNLLAGEMAEKELKLAKDPELKSNLQGILLGLLSEPKYQNKMQKLVGEMYDVADMSYVEHLEVIRAAVGANAWPTVDNHVAAAMHLATPEAFREAYPDRDFSDEYIAEAGRNRQGLLQTFAGWSAANQGQMKEALKTFEAAATMVRTSFFGLPENDLYRYWGYTLLNISELEAGVEKLALANIYNRDSDAGEEAREAYAVIGRKQAFDDYLWELRQKHAPKVENFTAVDYTDAAHSYDSLRGKKATLLAFWFPT